jgi:hypothetical protein
MSLLSEFLVLTQGWRTVFPQQRTFQRAVRQTLDSPGVPGTPRPVAHYLDQGRPESQLERGIFLALALPVGAARVVSAESEAGPGLLPATAGRSGSRRYPVAQDRTMYSPSLLPTRSVITALPRESDAGLALCTGSAVDAAAPQSARVPCRLVFRKCRVSSAPASVRSIIK